MSTYSLSTILATFTKDDGHKRLIYNHAPLGGLSSKSIILFCVLLPFIEYAAIFNSYVFGKLGIAQAIIFFIIFLVFIMQVVFGIVWWNNRKLKQRITPSWEEYFPDIELPLVLAGGSSPYREFFNRYATLDRDLDETTLKAELDRLFIGMHEENSELIAAMKQERVR